MATPEKLGRYEILGELGQGAMGVVYLARDPLIGRQLALKTFRLGYSAGDRELEQFRTRFLREAQSAGILNHPNIVTIHDVVVDPGGDFFIAMEYVQGTDLKLLMQRQRLRLDAALELIAQIADGLGYAHSKGVVHRDIKPANIIITADKQAKITDFGIARVETSNLTTEGQLLGTPNYMAPEQIQGREVDYRADVFSLGVMLYETVTGKKPFAAENLAAVTHKIVFEPFPALDESLPPELTRVLDRALAKDPAARYDGAEMAADLRAILAPEGTATVAAPDTSRSGSFLNPAAPVPAASPPASAPAGDATFAVPAASAPPPSPAPPTPPEGEVLPSIEATLTGSTAAVPPPSAAASAPGTGPVPADAGRSAGRRSFLGLPPLGRVALAVGAALVAGVIAVGVARLAMTDEALPEAPSPGLDRDLEILPHLKRGQELLAASDPEAALEAFERALAIAPDDRDVRRWRDLAQRAVDDLDGVEAVDVGEGPGGEPPRGPPAAPAGAPTAVPPPAAPAAKATLVLDFHSEASEGRLTIFDGQDLLYQQPFKFVTGGSGLLRRSRGTSGGMKGNLTLPSGDVALRIYVKLRDVKTRSAEIKGNLPPGGTRTLRIRVLDDEGRFTADLE